MKELRLVVTCLFLATALCACTATDPSPVPPSGLYAVRYHADGCSGIVPTDLNTYDAGDQVTVLDGGGLTDAGCTFAGWTTSTAGAGSSYAPAFTFSMGTADVDLYAVWIPDMLTFTSTGANIVVTGYTASPSAALAIPGGVTEIGDNALRNGLALTSITMTESVTRIGAGAFEGCTALATVEIPASITIIEDRLFSGCLDLAAISLPTNVTFIGKSAFADCVSLSSIAVPSGVTMIDQHAFGGCLGLVTVSVPVSVRIAENVFEGCANLASFTLPANAPSIAAETFAGCTSLVSIVIPAGVQHIGGHAFDSCAALTNVTMEAATPPQLADATVFCNCSGSLRIHVPDAAAVTAYQLAPYWSSCTIVTP